MNLLSSLIIPLAVNNFIRQDNIMSLHIFSIMTEECGITGIIQCNSCNSRLRTFMLENFGFSHEDLNITS